MYSLWYMIFTCLCFGYFISYWKVYGIDLLTFFMVTFVALRESYDCPGARLTKAYDVTIQRYRNLHAKIEDSKIHILRCMGSKLCVKFQRFPLTYDILELWHLKS